MKVGFLSISFNLIEDTNNVGNIEVLKMADLLRQRGLDVDCLCYESTKYAKAFNEVDYKDYDAFIVMSGGVDFFAGVFNPILAANYEFLAKVNQPIFYMFDDLSLPFNQIYINVARAIGKYKAKELTPEILKPYKDKYFITAPAIIVSQGRNLEIAKKLHKKSEINIVDYVYNPNNEWLTLTDEPYRENTGEFDLIIGGSLRKAKARQLTYCKYMFDQIDIKTAMYGTASLAKFDKEVVEDLIPPTFLGKKKYQDVIDTNARGYATLITGDKSYRDNVVTLRLAESILANCICFIDEIYDSEHFIFPKEPCLYVNTKSDVAEKIQILKGNKERYDELIAYQHEVYNKMRQNDCMSKLIKIIENYCIK